jgi:aminopeptidase N
MAARAPAHSRPVEQALDTRSGEHSSRVPRDQGELPGPVASASTCRRSLAEIDDGRRVKIETARSRVRRRVWDLIVARRGHAPAIDHVLCDKATYDITITVPAGLQTISNGEPHGSRTTDGWTTYKWHEAKPEATYLATLAVGKFEIHEGRTKSGLPVITAYSPDVDPTLLKAAKASVETTPEVIDWESKIFGPYPFTSIGGYVPNVTSHFSLEEQTRVFYSPAAFSTGVRPYLIVHENAHQWFGDSVSLSTWRDIWLNEGFATYAEWLWSEKTGQGTAAEVAEKTYDSYPADDPFWQVKAGDPGPGENQFDDAVYDRGAMTLQALRATVGDAKFFAILRAWAAFHRYGNATTAQFEALSEKISGKDLGSLFTTWLYTTGRPAAPPQQVTLKSTPKSWKEIRQTRTVEAH